MCVVYYSYVDVIQSRRGEAKTKFQGVLRSTACLRTARVRIKACVIVFGVVSWRRRVLAVLARELDRKSDRDKRN